MAKELKINITDSFVTFTINAEIPLNISYDRVNDYFILSNNDFYDIITKDFYEVTNELNCFVIENNLDVNLPNIMKLRNEYNLNLNEFEFLSRVHIDKNNGFSFNISTNYYVEIFDRGFRYIYNVTKYNKSGKIVYKSSETVFKELNKNKINLLNSFKEEIPNFVRYESELNKILNRMSYIIFKE